VTTTTDNVIVERAAKNPIAGVRTFYVPSDSEEGKLYLVVEVKRDGKTTYYCQCSDFFSRRLPFIGTNLFSLCKHGAAVKERVSR
jgi:flavoprotein